jgi:outer membrane scaffolding protein for murein synthesis (MipA/OmpV family)
LNIFKILLFFILFFAQTIWANEQVIPKEQNANTETNRNKSENTAHYSIGFGVSMMTIDDYIGADESRFYFIPTPYIYYQNDSVVIDRNAFEGDLFNNKKWHLALDAAGSIPVDSSKNKTRQGMDDLDWVGELGPSLEYYFAGDSRSQNRTFIDFSVRKAVHTDFKKIADAGWTSQISLNNKYQFNADILGGRTIIDSSVAALFYSDKYAQYFYSVSADDAKDNRAEYSAKGGYAGIKVSFGGTWRRENIWLGLFTRYTYLKNTSFDDSPLMKSNANLLIGLSVSYIFMEK